MDQIVGYAKKGTKIMDIDIIVSLQDYQLTAKSC